MRKLLLYFFLLALVHTSYSQDAGNQYPVSWSLNLQTRMTPVELPPLNLYQVYQEDLINDKDKSKPWRYGITREITLDLKNDGVLTELPNGDKIWQLAIKSPNAINLSVNFDQFYIPEGGRLYLYNDDHSDFSKIYSGKSNRPNEKLGSWFVTGDIIWVEYFQPRSVVEESKLRIGGLIHGYRMGRVEQFVEGIRGLNDSGDCNYDVNCPVGEDFDTKKDLVKKAVTLLNLGNGFLCSAVLINNTRADKRPFLLTGITALRIVTLHSGRCALIG